MTDLATLLDTLEAAQVTGIAALREMIGCRYIRATPELLALVEEAIKFEKAVHTNSWTVEYVQRAALAYARAQVQP